MCKFTWLVWEIFDHIRSLFAENFFQSNHCLHRQHVFVCFCSNRMVFCVVFQQGRAARGSSGGGNLAGSRLIMLPASLVPCDEDCRFEWGMGELGVWRFDRCKWRDLVLLLLSCLRKIPAFSFNLPGDFSAGKANWYFLEHHLFGAQAF